MSLKKNTQADCARLVFVLSNGPMSDHSSSSFVPLCFAWLKSCASNFCRERRTTSPSITICLHRLIYIILPWQVWRSRVQSVENKTTNGIIENFRPASLLWHVCGCRTKSRIMKDTQKIPNPQNWDWFYKYIGVTESQLASMKEPSKKTMVKFLVDVFMEMGYTLNATSCPTQIWYDSIRVFPKLEVPPNPPF